VVAQMSFSDLKCIQMIFISSKTLIRGCPNWLPVQSDWNVSGVTREPPVCHSARAGIYGDLPSHSTSILSMHRALSHPTCVPKIGLSGKGICCSPTQMGPSTVRVLLPHPFEPALPPGNNLHHCCETSTCPPAAVYVGPTVTQSA